MKIGYLSDVHLECKNQPEIKLTEDIDVLIVAGDVVPGLGAIQWIVDNFVGKVADIIYVAGNHEGWGYHWNELIPFFKRNCAEHGIHFLDDSSVEIGGYTFLGGTCWTDFAFDQPDLKISMINAWTYMGDYHRIGYRESDGTSRMILPEDVLALNNTTKKFIFDCIRECGRDKAVVITHHGPTPSSIGPKFIGNSSNAYFVNDWENLITSEGPKYWFHGHVHHQVDYVVGDTRVLAAPRGYTGEETGFTGIKIVTLGEDDATS